MRVDETMVELSELEEGVDVELRRASGRDGRGEVPRSFFETYAAMANTDGGIVYLGVTERDDVRIATGIGDVARMRKALWDSLNNRKQVSRNLLRDDAVQVLSFGDHKVLRIEIPRASRHERPVYVGENPLEGTYRRNFEGDYRCDAETVRRMDVPTAESAAVFVSSAGTTGVQTTGVQTTGVQTTGVQTTGVQTTGVDQRDRNGDLRPDSKYLVRTLEALPPETTGVPETSTGAERRETAAENGAEGIEPGDAPAPDDAEVVQGSPAWAALEELAKPVTSQAKPRRSTVEATILALCQGRWLLLRDVAALLQRDPDWLRKNYLSPMVEEQRLSHRYPASPRHSRQAYQAASHPGGDDD